MLRFARLAIRPLRRIRRAFRSHGESATAPAEELNHLLDGHRMTQLLYVAAKLGIADMLKDGPKRCEELAVAVGADPGALYRFLRHLAAYGIFAMDEHGRVTLNPPAEPLAGGTLGSVRPRALLIGEVWERAYQGLLYSVRTGKPAFDHVFGMAEYEYFSRHPEAGENYDAAISTWTNEIAKAIAAAYDFSRFGAIVDVGGGQGALVAAILKAHPGARGILCDLPGAIRGARIRLEAEGVAQRCDLVAGSFFESVPEGGDAYILKWIFVDWDDEHVVAILKNCRRAMKPGAILLAIDPLMTSDYALSATTLDIQMLVLNGGRARTESEYRSLFERGGFRVLRVIPIASAALYSIVEGVAAS